MRLPDTNIAISGMAGRFPKCNSVNEYEKHLYEGVDMINERDESRFQCGLWGLPPRAGRLPALDEFDCEFFGIPAEQANFVDFQLRILYEVVYESILDAGVNPATLRGSKTGVFFGLHTNEVENITYDFEQHVSNGYYAQFAVKIAQYFDLRGTTITFDAACASGFVGFHNAVEALELGLIDQAIVCSSNIPVTPTNSFVFLQMQMLSPTGYSRFLDSRADGYVKSEACVSMLLQRKDVAKRNYASVMATMASVDGYKREGITFPSDKSQERLIRATKQLARINTNHVEYLEAHGTGTPAGDPQEANAIANVYYNNDDTAEAGPNQMMHNDKDTQDGGEREHERRTIGPLRVCSVKTNMGHSEAASGLCALVKVALQLEHELMYKGLHYEQPNVNIKPVVDGRLKFVEHRTPLRGKIIPLSCYGFGGANVHAIVRASERPALSDDCVKGEPELRLVVMFGRDQQALQSFFDHIENAQQSRATKFCLADDFLALVDSLSAERIDRLMTHRGYIILDRSHSPARVLARHFARYELKPLESVHNDDVGRRMHLQECEPRKIVLVLPGLGSRWAGSLQAPDWQLVPHIWTTITRLATHLHPFDVDLMSLLTEKSTQAPKSHEFAAIVAVEIALVGLVRDALRVRSLAGCVGHSIGELACAFAAGFIDEREAILLAYHLGAAMDAIRVQLAGKTIALAMSEREADAKIDAIGCDTLRVCCVNGAHSVTVSGSHEDIERFTSQLIDAQISQIDAEFALHNQVLSTQTVRENLLQAANKVIGGSHKLARSLWSTSTVASDEPLDFCAEYLVANLCNPVRFDAAICSLPADSIALELAASPVLASQIATLPGSISYLSLLPRDVQETGALGLLQNIGQLYELGASMDLSGLYLSAARDKLFPVRRRTPSLSSLFKWRREHKMFVPQYPAQFSKSSAKCEVPVDLLDERNKYLAGHCIEGRALHPATGYLLLAWRVFSLTQRRLYDVCFHDVERELIPVEFRSVRLLRAVVLQNDRTAQIYVHYDEATGRFEIKEGGSIVCEGYAMSPSEKPNALMYEHVRERLARDTASDKLELSADDVYKQFRVCGYDYGKTFQCIEAASRDGRRARVKFNGHFVSLTDSILQTIFLAASQFAPSGGLYLPTRFDYVRFLPDVILGKIREANMQFDAESRLDTRAKRDIMTKIMQRDTEAGATSSGETAVSDAADEVKAQEAAQRDNEKECIFETYCDPVTGIIVTDGIEMRGIRASPAPRRADANEVLLESYQFVPDVETPITDEPLTRYASRVQPYVRACNALAMKLLTSVFADDDKITAMIGARSRKSQSSCDQVASADEASKYVAKHVHKQQGDDAVSSEQTLAELTNGARPRTLLAVLDAALRRIPMDKLAEVAHSHSDRLAALRKLLRANRAHLVHDLLQEAHMGERTWRPLVETIVECVERSSPTRLRVLEINPDDALLRDRLRQLVAATAPQMQLEYALAHPEPGRLKLNGETASSSRTYELRVDDVAALFSDHGSLKDLDAIVYKDISCYSLPKQQLEADGIAPALATLSNACKRDGFIVVVMRERLTLAERVLLALAEPQLVESHSSGGDDDSKPARRLAKLDAILAARKQHMLDEADKQQMRLVAQKSDPSGSLVLMFRNNRGDADAADACDASTSDVQALRVERGANLEAWLDRLKAMFQDADETQQQDRARPVWLCAVASRQQPVSGLIGMMQALRKELGVARLRCHYDAHTFRDRDEPISIEEIKLSAQFRAALDRKLVWNCVDERGQVGAFRHFTVNEFMSYEDCVCAVAEDASKQCEPIGAFANIGQRGDLSSFAWFEVPHKHLRDKSHLVRVSYAALNFRDVMVATGRLPLDSLPARTAQSECALGLEVAGVNARGERVMCMLADSGIATHVVCEPGASICLPVPADMSLREAATIPVVYATAVMALRVRGRARSGETVLIHAASGGVGQAALHLCAHYGMRIYATVGTEDKRQFLLENFAHCLDEAHLFSSRNCDFEHEIMRATQGRGVDIVLNSLADDKLQASLRCLADGGRFLEIGKYDLAMDTRLELTQLDDNKTMHGILLDKLFDPSDAATSSFRSQIEQISDELRRGLQLGYIKPIKQHVFARNEIESAFRFMATGKHMGKVLIAIDSTLDNAPASSVTRVPKCVPRVQLDPCKGYLVTGGLGGFGVELIKWLVQQGARYVTVTSRTGVRTGYQRWTLERLERTSGAQIQVVTTSQCDASESPQQAALLVDIAREETPARALGGVFHLAMVLKDALLANMSAQDFELVCKPKVDTCAHLDEVLREPEHASQLDLFVVFSSVTSGKGNAGQANYAYANSCIERICERRRADKLHALAVQWGAIGDVGVAYDMLGGNDVIVGGTRPQRMPSCFSTLSKLLCAPFAVCLSVLPVKRNADGASERGDLVSAVLHVLGIKDHSKVSEHATLGELGLDSLMAVEIRQYIEREYEIQLNIQEIRSLTIEKIRELSDKGKPAAGAKQKSAAIAQDAAAAAAAQKPVVQSYSSLEAKTIKQ